MKSNKLIVWLVGATSPLAQSISQELAPDYSIISFGRNPSCDRLVDLTSTEAMQTVFRDCIKDTGVPKAILFCQRFRPSKLDLELDSLALLSKATTVEVYPLLAINSALLSLGLTNLNVRMIVFSSTVALQGHNRSPRYYSVTKSIVAGLLPVLTSEVLHLGCTWNCILLSEFFKGNKAHTFQRLKQLAKVSKQHVQGKIPRVEDIASFVRFLIGDTAVYMNGESIVFDGGYIKYGQDN